MLVDSHCHLDFPELASDVEGALALMRKNQVERALCVSVTLADFPRVLALAEKYPELYASVGVHPDYEEVAPAAVGELVRLARHPKVVAIGETGLDYYRLKGDLGWQRDRFRTHIRAAQESGKPLIIHSRSAAEDTLQIMRDEGAGQVGGVMHCFTESWDMARVAMEMGFYISFSGIVTFKNAKYIKEVVRQVPLEKLLVETDAPYLAPVPHRGKTNQPAYVRHVAEEIARIKGLDLSEVARVTTNNFNSLFKILQEKSNEIH
jgi:TatD DNase family protein